MKTTAQVMDRLNQLLTLELTAINQYWLHARICKNWGYERLWKKIREEAMGEMKHADRIVERVLFLDGLPNLQRLSKVNVGQTVVEILKLDLDVERSSRKILNDSIELARADGDHGTRELLEEILVDTEEHLDWLESQLTLVEQVGEQNYLAQQIKNEG
jgi:bacterioferritin